PAAPSPRREIKRLPARGTENSNSSRSDGESVSPMPFMAAGAPSVRWRTRGGGEKLVGRRGLDPLRRCGASSTAGDQRERHAQQQHKCAKNNKAFTRTPTVGDPAYERWDQDRGEPLPSLTQTHDYTLLMATDRPRL